MAELLNAGMWAAELGVSAKKFKEVLEKTGVKPDATKNGRDCYTRETARHVAKNIERMSIVDEASAQSLKNEAYKKDEDD